MLNKSAQPSKIGAITNINMTKCQYQQCKRVLNTRAERIKQNGNQIKSAHMSADHISFTLLILTLYRKTVLGSAQVLQLP